MRLHGYVTRDRNGDVFLWRKEPTKNEEKGEWVHPIPWAAWRYLSEDDLEDGVNPKWEDCCPIKVRIEYFETNIQIYQDFLTNNKTRKNGIQATRLSEESDQVCT